MNKAYNIIIIYLKRVFMIVLFVSKFVFLENILCHQYNLFTPDLFKNIGVWSSQGFQISLGFVFLLFDLDLKSQVGFKLLVISVCCCRQYSSLFTWSTRQIRLFFPNDDPVTNVTASSVGRGKRVTEKYIQIKL